MKSTLVARQAAYSTRAAVPHACATQRRALSCVRDVRARVAEADAPSSSAGAEEPERQKVAMMSMGCPKNTVDGEVLLGDLYRSGFDIVDETEDADVVMVNTCGFIEDAQAESIEAIIQAVQLKNEGTAKKVVVTGCMAQRYADTLADEVPEADLVMGFENYANLPSSLRASLGMDADVDPDEYAQRSRVQVGEATVGFRPEWDRHRLTPKHTAYLRVAEGCNHACTFCAIPSFRGKFRSKPWDAVLDEAKRLVESGVVELNLIAEDTNQYGMDRRDDKNLAVLMRELAKLEGLKWMRILYAYPSYFSEELIDEIANNDKVCKYIDIPLQHIANMTLLAMNRPPQKHTVDLLYKLRERIPGLVLRTTFISGFPGESEADHNELVKFCRDFKFERMGVFSYSSEEGTPAAEFEEEIDDDVKEYRRDELMAQQQAICEAFAKVRVGQEVDVLIDGYDADGWLVGRTQYDAPDVDPVVFVSPPEDDSIPAPEPGQMRRCVITGNSLYDLEAQPIA